MRVFKEARVAHLSVVFSALHEMQQRQQLCDLDLICQGGETVPVHKCVMFAACPFLRIFMDINNYGATDLPCASIEPVKSVVHFLYTGELLIDMMTVHGILNCAAFLGIRHVEEFCQQFLKESCAASIINMKNMQMNLEQSSPDFVKVESVDEAYDNALVPCEEFQYDLPNRKKRKNKSMATEKAKLVQEPAVKEKPRKRRQKLSPRKALSHIPEKHSSPLRNATKKRQKKTEQLTENLLSKYVKRMKIPRSKLLCVRARRLSAWAYSVMIQKFAACRSVGIKCNICKLKFKSQSHLLSHHSKTHRRYFKCKLCGSIKGSFKDMFLHLKWRHKRKQLKHKQNSTSASAHMLLNDSALNRKCQTPKSKSGSSINESVLEKIMPFRNYLGYYECLFLKCPFRTRRHPTMLKHVKMHERGSNYCASCERYFSDPTKTINHLFNKHGIRSPNLKIHTCSIDGCDFETTYKFSLRIHMQNHGEDGPRVTCSVCGKSFKNEICRKVHVERMHAMSLGITSFTCELCGEGFSARHWLVKHMKIKHSDEKEFNCPHCQYSTHNKGNFTEHMYNIHHIKLNPKMRTFHCEKCTYTSCSQTQFEDHMRVHGGVRDIPCPHCSLLFISRKNMQMHIRRVHKPKVHKCEKCDYTASVKAKVKEHFNLKHAAIKLKCYQCPHCLFTCTLSGNCRKHIMQKHPDFEVRVIKLSKEEAEKQALQGSGIGDGNTQGNQEQLSEQKTMVSHVSQGSDVTQVREGDPVPVVMQPQQGALSLSHLSQQEVVQPTVQRAAITQSNPESSQGQQGSYRYDWGFY